MMMIITRRKVLAGGLALGAVAATANGTQASTPGQLEAAIRSVVGEAEIRSGKVTLDLPPLVENGNTVAMSVTVDSPMTK